MTAPYAHDQPTVSDQRDQAAFFDLDNTIIAKAAMMAFRRTFHAGGLVSRRSLTRALIGQAVYVHLGASEHRLAKLRETILRITKGWQRDEVVALIEEALEEIVEPIIFAEAMDLIDSHRAAGRHIVIVSTSPEEIVVPLARHLGINEVIASRAEIDKDGRYTGEMAFYAYGPFKAQAMGELAEREHISLADSFAYSDSYADVPMLESVGHPVAVNPDRVLARLARERNWEIRHFVRPVRLRDRVRDRVGAPTRPKIAISIGALVALALAVGLGWWRVIRRSDNPVSFRDAI